MNGIARTCDHMVRSKETRKGLFSIPYLPKIGEKEPIVEAVAIAVEFIKHQGEVAYEVGKRQAIAITSTASTIGVGWSFFFFGIMQESWLSSSIGLMMVVAATYFLGYWTPRMLDGVRESLDVSGALRIYEKWFADRAKPEAPPKGE